MIGNYAKTMTIEDLYLSRDVYNIPTDIFRFGSRVVNTSVSDHSDENEIGSLAWTIAQAVAEGGGLIILPGNTTYDFTAAVYIPSNILVAMFGGKLAFASDDAKLVTSGGYFWAPSLPLFTSYAHQNLQVLAINAAWFGVTPATNDEDSLNVIGLTLAILAAHNAHLALQRMAVATVHLDSGNYGFLFDALHPTIPVYGGVEIRGKGKYSTYLISEDTTMPLDEPQSFFTQGGEIVGDLTFRDFSIIGTGRPDVTSFGLGDWPNRPYGIGIDVETTRFLTIDECGFYNLRGVGIYAAYGESQSDSDLRITNCDFGYGTRGSGLLNGSVLPTGIELGRADRYQINNNRMLNVVRGIVIGAPPDWEDDISNLHISGNLISGIDRIAPVPMGFHGIYLDLYDTQATPKCRNVLIESNLLEGLHSVPDTFTNGGITLKDRGDNTGRLSGVLVKGNVLRDLWPGIFCQGLLNSYLKDNVSEDANAAHQSVSPWYRIVHLYDCYNVVVMGGGARGLNFTCAVYEEVDAKVESVQNSNKIYLVQPAEQGVTHITVGVTYPNVFSQFSINSYTGFSHGLTFGDNVVQNGDPGIISAKIPVYDDDGVQIGWIPVVPTLT